MSGLKLIINQFSIHFQEEQARKEKMEFQEMVAKDKVASHYKHKFSKAVKKIAAMYKELEVGGASDLHPGF